MRGSGAPRVGTGAAAAMAAVLIALAPAYAWWLTARPLPTLPNLAVDAAGGWQSAPGFTTWVPHWIGADRQLRESFARDGQPVLLEINYYAAQRQDAELVNSQNFMIKQKDPHWSNVGETLTTADIAGQPQAVRQARMRGADGQRLLVWQWNLVNGQPTVNDQLAKLKLAFERVRGARDDGASVLIATPYDDAESIDAARATLARFAADMKPAIARALATVETP